MSWHRHFPRVPSIIISLPPTTAPIAMKPLPLPAGGFGSHEIRRSISMYHPSRTVSCACVCDPSRGYLLCRGYDVSCHMAKHFFALTRVHGGDLNSQRGLRGLQAFRVPAISSGVNRFGGYSATLYSSAFIFKVKLCPRSHRTIKTLATSSTHSPTHLLSSAEQHAGIPCASGLPSSKSYCHLIARQMCFG